MAGGPIVYCAEERDNGANLHLLHPDGNALSGDASRVKSEPFIFQAGAYLDDSQAEAILIPYFARSNRGENEMRVFLDVG